jgi:hypothetical protein
VDEDVIAVFALNETIALSAAEPLDRADGSFAHCLAHLLPHDAIGQSKFVPEYCLPARTASGLAYII